MDSSNALVPWVAGYLWSSGGMLDGARSQIAHRTLQMEEAAALPMHSVDVSELQSAEPLQLAEIHRGCGCMMQQPGWSEVCFGAYQPVALVHRMQQSD